MWVLFSRRLWDLKIPIQNLKALYSGGQRVGDTHAGWAFQSGSDCRSVSYSSDRHSREHSSAGCKKRQPHDPENDPPRLAIGFKLPTIVLMSTKRFATLRSVSIGMGCVISARPFKIHKQNGELIFHFKNHEGDAKPSTNGCGDHRKLQINGRGEFEQEFFLSEGLSAQGDRRLSRSKTWCAVACTAYFGELGDVQVAAKRADHGVPSL